MRVVDPGPVGDQGSRITELWAWTAVSAVHDTEGIIALEKPDGGGLPLVGSVRSIIEKFKPYAEEVGRQSGATVQLRRFVAAES